jgi:hypothetical protein
VVGPKSETTESLETLIASRRVDAWVMCLCEDDQEIKPTFRTLDWRFRGAIARALNIGAISTEPGVVSLLPCTRPVSDSGRETYRILTLGVRDRAAVTAAEVSQLTRNIGGLGLKSVGLSASDFGWTRAEATKRLQAKGVELCVTE